MSVRLLSHWRTFYTTGGGEMKEDASGEEFHVWLHKLLIGWPPAALDYISKTSSVLFVSIRGLDRTIGINRLIVKPPYFRKYFVPILAAI